MDSISRYRRNTIGIISLLFVSIIFLAFADFRHDVHINFSTQSGYFDDAFELRIYGGAGNLIYYTLDGSEPDMEDYLYDGKNPIFITDATDHENIYSARTDTSTAFLNELVDAYSEGNPYYTVPEYPVDKCNIVRASVFDDAGNCLDSITGIYFVGFRNKVGYEGIYMASIVTDPCNLFDYEKGIYTTGATFDDYKETAFYSDEEKRQKYWWWWDSNYSNRGSDWEREAVVTVFDDEGKVVLSEKCGIRIQGGGSRGKLPKSIGCYAREIYGGDNEFQSDLFCSGMYPHKFVFFSGGDDTAFKLKDYMVNVMEQDLRFATMDFIPCAVFLDGEYWGIHYITENYNADYINDHYKVEKDNVIMAKNGELSEGYEEDEALFWEMRDFISNNDMTVEENYKKACELIDIDSYIDYYAAQVYIARHNDWPGGNWAAWRTREPDGSAYGDCKWRWMLFDVNSGGLTVGHVDADTLSEVIMKDEQFYSLYLNEEFRVKFARRILEIGREVFSKENCNDFLDRFEREMKEPLSISNQRFYNDTRLEEFNQYVEGIRGFFMGRYDAVWNALVKNMGEGWLDQNGIQK